MWWILYCAIQAIPAQDPTAHLTFDTQARCEAQAQISNSFNELHCVCKGPDEGILLPIQGAEEENPPQPEPGGFYSLK